MSFRTNVLIGMAIVQGAGSEIGYFDYKCGEGNFTRVNVSNNRPLGNNEMIKVVYLRPNDTLHFHLIGNPFWKPIDALTKSSLYFLAWDMTNGERCGEHSVNVSLAKNKAFLSNFEDSALLKQLRRGCDGIPGTVGQLDACGVCEGDNRTCTDCAGVVNGKAVIGMLTNFTIYLNQFTKNIRFIF